MDNNVLAVVCGRKITDKDVNDMISTIPADKRGYYLSEQGRTQVLDQIISDELIYNYAKDKKVDESEDFKKEMELVKKNFLVQFMIGKIINKVNIDEDEVKNFYVNNKEKFKKEESVMAKHILVDTEEKALKIKSEIENGLAFEEAAKKYSSCPSKKDGGNLGTFTRGQMVPEFEDAAFKLKVGEIGGPVKTQFGYHLIKVEGKNGAQEKSFEEVKDIIKNNLIIEKKRKAYISFITDIKKEYKSQTK